MILLPHIPKWRLSENNLVVLDFRLGASFQIGTDNLESRNLIQQLLKSTESKMIVLLPTPAHKFCRAECSRQCHEDSPDM